MPVDMHPLQYAAYAFGCINALVCIGMFFVATQGSTLTLGRRITLCAIGISAVAYLSLRVALLYVGIH